MTYIFLGINHTFFTDHVEYETGPPTFNGKLLTNNSNFCSLWGSLDNHQKLVLKRTNSFGLQNKKILNIYCDRI